MSRAQTVRPNSQAIRAFCLKDDLTINALAGKAGVAQSAVWSYVNDKKRPTLLTLRKIATALNVPLQSICMDDLTENWAERESA